MMSHVIYLAYRTIFQGTCTDVESNQLEMIMKMCKKYIFKWGNHDITIRVVFSSDVDFARL